MLRLQSILSVRELLSWNRSKLDLPLAFLHRHLEQMKRKSSMKSKTTLSSFPNPDLAVGLAALDLVALDFVALNFASQLTLLFEPEFLHSEALP